MTAEQTITVNELRDWRATMARIETLLAEKRTQSSDVLTFPEAMRITRHKSTSAFYRWTLANKVRTCGKGTYLRSAIISGLERAQCVNAKKKTRK